MVKLYWERIIKIFLFWTVIFFILLLILEDLKPFLVRVHFTPHWLVPIILILLVWQIFSHDNYQPNLPNKKKLKFFGWLVAFSCWGVIYLFFQSFLIGLLGGGLIFILVRWYLHKLELYWEL